MQLIGYFNGTNWVALAPGLVGNISTISWSPSGLSIAIGGQFTGPNNISNVAIYNICIPPIPDPYNAEYFPSLDLASSGMTSLNDLHIVIRSPLVHGRSIATFSFPNAPNTTNCAAVTWARTIDLLACEEVYTADISYSGAQSGCFSQSQTSTNIILTALLNVQQVDTLASINGQNETRTQNTPFSLNLDFNRQLNVTSSSLTVFAPVGIIGAITSISYNTSQATILLFTSTQYPFILGSPSIVLSNVGVPPMAVTIATDPNYVASCSSTSATPYCDASWYIAVTNNATQAAVPCSLNATYTVLFNSLTCDAGYTEQCPFQGESATLQFTASSGSLCGSFSQTYGITGTLSSGQARSSYLQNDSINLIAVVNSPFVAVIETYISSCTLTNLINVTTLYSGATSSSTGIVSAQANAASFTIDPAPNATAAAFHFLGNSFHVFAHSIIICATCCFFFLFCSHSCFVPCFSCWEYSSNY